MITQTDREKENLFLDKVLSLVENQIKQRRVQLQEIKNTDFGFPQQGYNARVAGNWGVKNATTAIATLEKQGESPYFGRIDFVETTTCETETEIYYIGKSSIREGNDLVVIDWRAPVSSMYYGYGVGSASFKAPIGYIQGEILRKRQYTFVGCSLTDIHETTAASEVDNDKAVDELLLSVLERNSSAQMRQIVQSIQAEQNAIIRSAGDIVVVQGPAGSGKTVIALHRAAYLLYHMRDGRDRFATEDFITSARRMLIFSPSAIFSNYVSSVLPDLQEDSIQQVILDTIIQRNLSNCISNKSFVIEQKEDYYEYILISPDEPNYSRRSVCSAFKSSPQMIDYIRDFVGGFDQQVEDCFRDISAENPDVLTDQQESVFTRQDLIGHFQRQMNIHGISLIGKLDSVISLLIEEIARIEAGIKEITKQIRQAERRGASSLTLERELLELHRQRKMNFRPIKSEIDRLTATKNDLLQVNLLNQYLECLDKIHSDSHTPDNVREANMPQSTRAIFHNEHIHYEDALPLLLLNGFYRGFNPIKDINHAIVDEAQDYSLLHYEYIKNCLPERCSMTIVGDINQATNPHLNLSEYDSLSHVYYSGFKRLNLTRSYRSSSEITSFASRILGNVTIDNVRRSGQKPVLIALSEPAAILDAIVTEVKRLLASGSKTISVLCKTRRDCEAIYPFLHQSIDATLLTKGSKKLMEGVMILPVYLAKGLEFDAVIVHDAGQKYYNKDSERQLLYTACTRALHRLVVMYSGDPSPLLPIEHIDLYDKNL